MMRLLTGLALAFVLSACGGEVGAPPESEPLTAGAPADTTARPQVTWDEAQRLWNDGTSNMLVTDWRCVPAPTDQCLIRMRQGVWAGMTDPQKYDYATRVGRAALVIHGINYSKIVEADGSPVANYSAFRDTVDILAGN